MTLEFAPSQPNPTQVDWRQGLEYARALLSYAFAVQSHGWRNEVTALQLDHLTLAWPDLPPGLHGLRIVQLSDLHACSWVPEEHLRRAVALAQAQSPDLIVLTGDFIQLKREADHYANRCAQIVADLTAPLGVYAVLGNHDYWGDPRIVTRAFEQVGIPMLINRARRLAVGGDDLWLVGLDDARHGEPNLPHALNGVPSDGFKILLAHEPDIADDTHRHGIHLQLSGHSHGAQVDIPGVRPFWLPRLGRKYHRGLYRVGDMWLYTNRGLGSGYPAIRHNCPPEVTVIQLERSSVQTFERSNV